MSSQDELNTDLRRIRKLPRNVAFWPDPEFPAWIKTLPMPHARRERYSWPTLTLLVILLFLLASIFPTLTLIQRGWSTITPLEQGIMVVFYLIPLGLLVGHAYQGRRERRFVKRRFRDSKWAPWLRALTRSRLPLRACGPGVASPAHQRLLDELAAESLQTPRTLADLRLAAQLEHIELPDVLLEAEKVFPGSRVGRRRARGMIIIGCIITLLGFMMAFAVCTIFGLLMIIIPLLSINYMRRKVPELRLGISVPVAGTGFLKINDQLSFRSDSAICLVRAIDSDRRTDPAVEAWFLSAEAVRYFSFPTCRDPHFITLWQRWNHPSPRPELAPSD